ncbi:hypothetical protein ACFW04_009051 [Cataglyphis niger]
MHLYFRYKVQVASRDVEAALADEKSFDPFAERKVENPTTYLIQISLFVTYFGTCSVYAVIVAANFKQIIEHYQDNDAGEYSIRLITAYLLIPMILLSWVPDLKYLAPVSMVANIFMGTGLGITFYYLVWDIPPLSSIPLVGSIETFPQFFSITIFAMEAIGVVMPLENSMKTPQHLVGICGVLNKGMSGVTLVYIFLGFLGYVKYQDETMGSITLNLPTEEIAAQVVKILIALAVFCTFGLQFYVCLDIGWNFIKHRFEKKPLLANYIMRTVLVTGAVLLAIAVPTIEPFIGLIGAFCFSILGLIIPVFIETVTYWDVGFGPGNWVALKNVIICVIGVMALIFGSRSAIIDIVKLYA